MVQTLLKTKIQTALVDYPAIAAEAICVAAMPLLPCDYNPIDIEIFFDDVSVLLQRSGVVIHHLSFAPDYVPDVLTLYGDQELLLVKANGEILINRLPEAFVKAEWKSYGK